MKAILVIQMNLKIGEEKEDYKEAMRDRTPIEVVTNCMKCMDKHNEEDGCPICGKEILECYTCNKMFMGVPPKVCCNSSDCGCQGLPIEPVVCSNECYNDVMNNKPVNW